MLLRSFRQPCSALSVGMLVAARGRRPARPERDRRDQSDLFPGRRRAPPRAIDPDASAGRPAAYAQAYDWEQGRAARAVDCGGNCDARQIRQAAAMAIDVVRPRRAAPWWRDADRRRRARRPGRRARPAHAGSASSATCDYPIEEADAEESAAERRGNAAADPSRRGRVAAGRPDENRHCALRSPRPAARCC